MSDSERLIKKLQMIAHPEGGHFSESFRDKNNNVSLIYYMLQKNEWSHWHRLTKNEILHFYKGDPLIIYTSKDGIDFKRIDTFQLESPSPSDEVEIKTIEFKTNTNQYRYIKLIAKTYGTLPNWHLGFPHDGKSWLFADEISIN